MRAPTILIEENGRYRGTGAVWACYTNTSKVSLIARCSSAIAPKMAKRSARGTILKHSFLRPALSFKISRSDQTDEASSIHFDEGLSAPYLDLPLLRSGIPSKSLTPRIQWNFTPGKSFTLPPLTKTIECSCKL